MKLKEIIKQPTEGLLYDLNRNEAIILTLIDDLKWVNDYACMAVICELKKQLELKDKQIKKLEKNGNNIKSRTKRKPINY